MLADCALRCPFRTDARPAHRQPLSVPTPGIWQATPVCLATAIYDYEPNTDEEISIREGDLVRVYEKVDADWWFVKQDHNVGLIPATYVEEQSSLDGQPAEAPLPPLPAEVRSGSPDQASFQPEQQKHQLLNALNGLGFVKPKSEPRNMAAHMYGPDDIKYYPLTEIDKKKKKNSKKGLLGFSDQDGAIYFVEDPSREIISKIPIKELTRYKDKKTKLVLEFEGKDAKDYEGEKVDVHGAVAELEQVLNKTKNGNVVSGSPPSAKTTFAAPVPIAAAMTPTLPVAAARPPPPSPSPASLSSAATAPVKTALALYDYDPVEEGELQIRENDKVVVMDDTDPDWWLVRIVGRPGAEGLVPKTYVELQSGAASPAHQGPDNAALEARRREEEAAQRRADEAARQREEDQRRKAQEDARRRDEEQQRRKREEEERRHAEEERLKQEQAAAAARPPVVEPPRLPTRPAAVTSPVPPPAPPAPASAPPAPPAPAPPAQPTLAAALAARKPLSNAPSIPDRPQVPASRPVTSAPKDTKVKPANEMPDPSKLRKWKDRSGSFEVDAAYVGLSEGKVQLHKSNGVKIAVPLEKLSPADVEYVQSLPGNEHLAAASGATPAPPKPKTGGSTMNLAGGSGASASEFTHNGFNWREWLIKAGLASKDAESLGRRFADQHMDQTILPDLDRDALRAMGITEGDIIRIRKAANLPSLTPATQQLTAAREKEAQARNLQMLDARMAMRAQSSGQPSSTASLEQIKADEAFARELQNQENRLARNGSTATSSGLSVPGAGSAASRKPSVGGQSNSVNMATIQQAGNLLKASNTSRISPPTVRRTSNVSNASTTSFNVPPSTQEVNAASSLGLKSIGGAFGGPAGASNSSDPWGGSASPGRNAATQEQLLKIQMQQEEAKRTIASAEQAVLRAQEQNRQAALLEQQAMLKVAQQQQQLQAQQQQINAQQQLLQAQQRAAIQAQTAAMQARPLPAPLIPTNTGGSGRFVPTGPVAQQPAMGTGAGVAQGIQTMVTPAGVVRPNWMNTTPQMPFGPAPTGPAITSNDRYAAFKEVNPAAPSLFNQSAATVAQQQQQQNQQQQQQQMNQPAGAFGAFGGMNNNAAAAFRPGMALPAQAGQAAFGNMGMGMGGMGTVNTMQATTPAFVASTGAGVQPIGGINAFNNQTIRPNMAAGPNMGNMGMGMGMGIGMGGLPNTANAGMMGMAGNGMGGMGVMGVMGMQGASVNSFNPQMNMGMNMAGLTPQQQQQLLLQQQQQQQQQQQFAMGRSGFQ
ncbi:hypothetical protein BC831DRAFT_413476 [Entophlyctis helioformis]|nr:hypothetical protein BC831DRAFT_413476 [Entophlyctis helioformis]